MSVRKAFTKHRKFNKGKIREKCYCGFTLNEGDIGLKAIESGRVTEKQIETIRRLINKTIEKRGKILLRIYPHRAITKKPQETRMGGGKSSIDHRVAIVEAGRILLEIDGVEENLAIEALKSVQYKLPISTKIIHRII